MNFVHSLLKRLTEPSSYAGLAASLGAGAHMIETGETSSALVGTLLLGLGAFFKGEPGNR